MRWLRLALLSGVSLAAFAAHAQTWVGGGAPDQNEWLQDNNWASPATVPTATAIFDVSATTAVHNDAGLVSIDAISFLSTASAYTFSVDNIFIVTGGGVANNSANIQTFNVLDTSVSMIFHNSSTANSGSGAVNYNNNGFMYFFDTSNAGNANTNIVNSEIIQFFDNSSGGSAQFTNNVLMDFFDSSTAGSATITNNATGTLTFNNNSTAANATIDNSGGLQFNNSATAGSATITNNSGGTIDFSNSATAGASSLTNNAGGTVTFHDSSTGGSGATLINNGTWDFNDSSSLGSSALTNNATMNFNNSSNAGTASASINNNDTLNFNNSSSAGSAQITNGSFLIFNNSASAGSATITNSSALIFNNSASAASANITSNTSLYFYDSSTAGSASITTQLGGATTFAGTSSGGTATFVTNVGSALDISSLTNGGTTAGSIAGAGNIFLGANTFTVGSNNTSTVVSGVIQDGGNGGGTGGGLTKVGTGTLTLSNTNTYTGATNVNDGVLQVDGSIVTSSLTTVNNNGMLTGIGVVGNTNVASGGIFHPGSGTSGSMMTVTGNLGFASGAIYAVDLDPTTASQAVVSATATLGGATVNAIFAPGSYLPKQYTILTAGSVSGTFGGLVNFNLPAGLDDSLSYDGTHAYLDLALNYLPPGGSLNTNQQNVANGLINSFNVNGGIPTAFVGLTPSQLTQVSGEVGADFAHVAFQAGNSFLNLMLDPFVDGRFHSSGFGAIGYADEARPARRAATDAFAAMPKKAPTLNDRYSIWGAAYGGSGRVDGNNTTGSNDTKTQTYGFAAGLDYKLTPDSLVGFALAGGGTHWSLDLGLGSGRSDMFQAGIYGKSRWGAAYLAGALAYSYHDVTTDRTVTIAGTDMLEANLHASVFSGRLETGYRYVMPMVGITPYGALQVQSIALPSYGESATSGSALFALNYDSQTVTTTRTELGARFDNTYLLDQGALLTLYSRAAWAHDFGNTASASAIFQALPASNFTVNGAQPWPDVALLSAGAEYKLANGWSVLAKFDGEFSKTAAIYSGSGQIRKMW